MKLTKGTSCLPLLICVHCIDFCSVNGLENGFRFGYRCCTSYSLDFDGVSWEDFELVGLSSVAVFWMWREMGNTDVGDGELERVTWSSVFPPDRLRRNPFVFQPRSLLFLVVDFCISLAVVLGAVEMTDMERVRIWPEVGSEKRLAVEAQC